MNPQEQADQLVLLQNEFNTLDSSLVAAIFNDTDDLESVRNTLNILNCETIVDDISPSEESWPEGGDSNSDETDPSTLSLSSWRISDEDDDTEETGQPGDKLGYLMKMFPKQSRFTLKTTLDKCQGDLGRAVDELLNRVFLNEDPEEAPIKGIDGFDSGINVNGGKKKHRNRKGKANGTESYPSDLQRSTSLPTENTKNNKWESMSHQIKYLASSLNLPEKAVASAYHHHSGAVAPTLISLLEQNARSTVSLEPSHLEELHVLRAEFGTDVEFDHLQALLKLCHENKVAVFELAEILRRHSLKPQIKVNTTSLSQVSSPLSPARSHLANANTNGWTVIGASYASPSMLPSPPTSPQYPNRPQNLYSAAQSLSSHADARNNAFTKAAESYRKSRSNPTMGAVASYYAEIGHHHNTQVKALREDVAERLIETNSKPNVLDLHGATVAQAVKIARERTTDWWVRQGRDLELAGRVGGSGWGRNAPEPFHIITGLGRHSKGGVAQLLPAVSRMLMRENWKIQVEQGHIIVYGVAKKR